MKFVTLMKNGKASLGVKTDRGIVDLASAKNTVPVTGNRMIPDDIMQVIGAGGSVLADIGKYVEEVMAGGHADGCFVDETSAEFGPCVTRPSKIICVGLNYRRHAEETNAAIPAFPILFNKFPNTLTGHGSDVELNSESRKIDYEAELAIVIGKRAKAVAKEDALSHVFGYCAVNDLSARDLQMRTHQWMLGKCCDGFSPLGPYLATAEEVGDPNRLEIKCSVNGELRQNSNTSDMIFACDEIISYISRHMTLWPGDVILTGTPEGVVLGYPEHRQIYLRPGDIVNVEIEKLGQLTNRMVEPAV